MAIAKTRAASIFDIKSLLTDFPTKVMIKTLKLNALKTVFLFSSYL